MNYDENKNRETVADIIAEMRMGDDGGKPAYRIGRADKIEISMPSGQPIRSMVIEDVHILELADRIEAARKREAEPVKGSHDFGNAAATREALKTLLNLAYVVQDENSEDGPKTRVPEQFIIDVAKSALSLPARNCDVGTSADQNNLYEHYCFTHRTMERCCQDCPIKDEPCCELAWAQMPYEAEEGAGE